MDFAYLGLNGHTLSPSERASLEMTKPLLASQHKGDVNFWGKIMALEADYLLVRITGENCLHDSTTLYSVDGGLNWNLIEPSTEKQREMASKVRGLFSGNPKYEYRQEEPVEEVEEIPGEKSEAPGETEEVEEGEEEEEEEKEEEKEEEEKEEEEQGEPIPEKKKPKKKFNILILKESSRLSVLVEEVDYYCRLVPRGALLLDESGNVVVNRTFEGLPKLEAGKLSSYFHARLTSPPQGTPIGNPNVDFLENITQDIPQGVWVFKYDPLLQIVVGSNLLYEGFTFYHKPGTSLYGQYYIGNGERNVDLCFLL